ncbi:hypothetical protein VTJ04DRAFT_10088 [Mycothermus thermophilus]|uniref:uncharacterized protein n=1 Tax=Humicola insolens TaxID=85995 RepID=UPI0037423441
MATITTRCLLYMNMYRLCGPFFNPSNVFDFSISSTGRPTSNLTMLQRAAFTSIVHLCLEDGFRKVLQVARPTYPVDVASNFAGWGSPSFKLNQTCVIGHLPPPVAPSESPTIVMPKARMEAWNLGPDGIRDLRFNILREARLYVQA